MEHRRAIGRLGAELDRFGAFLQGTWVLVSVEEVRDIAIHKAVGESGFIDRMLVKQ
jgi:hypothetical protein